MTTTDPVTAARVATVRDLLDRLGRSVDEACRALAEYCTNDLVWENSGRRTCHGIAEAQALARRGADELHFDDCRVEYRTIAVGEGVVMVERDDHLCRADGTIVVSMAVVGVFVFRGIRIARWSDYFDYAAFRAPEPAAQPG